MLILVKSSVGILAPNIIRTSSTEALKVALSTRSKPPEIFHSDQGSEYRSQGFEQDSNRKKYPSLNER